MELVSHGKVQEEDPVRKRTLPQLNLKLKVECEKLAFPIFSADVVERLPLLPHT